MRELACAAWHYSITLLQTSYNSCQHAGCLPDQGVRASRRAQGFLLLRAGVRLSCLWVSSDQWHKGYTMALWHLLYTLVLHALARPQPPSEAISGLISHGFCDAAGAGLQGMLLLLLRLGWQQRLWTTTRPCWTMPELERARLSRACTSSLPTCATSARRCPSQSFAMNSDHMTRRQQKCAGSILCQQAARPSEQLMKRQELWTCCCRLSDALRARLTVLCRRPKTLQP